jgi:hypothetical protein
VGIIKNNAGIPACFGRIDPGKENYRHIEVTVEEFRRMTGQNDAGYIVETGIFFPGIDHFRFLLISLLPEGQTEGFLLPGKRRSIVKNQDTPLSLSQKTRREARPVIIRVPIGTEPQ